MKLRKHALQTAGLLSLATLAGCAQTTVQPVQETFSTNLPPPAVVLVYQFSANLNEVTANQGLFQKAIDAAESTSQDAQSADIAHQVADRLADEMVQRINSLGLPAQRATPETIVPANALVITGHFVDIDEGNRLRRLVIGFGAGASKVDTQVQVMTPASSGYRTLLEFNTHADSGEMPGAAVTMGAGAAAQGAVTGGMAAANVAIGGVNAYRSEVERMAGKTADKAAQFLSQFFGRQGWISPDNVQAPTTL